MDVVLPSEKEDIDSFLLEAKGVGDGGLLSLLSESSVLLVVIDTTVERGICFIS